LSGFPFQHSTCRGGPDAPKISLLAGGGSPALISARIKKNRRRFILTSLRGGTIAEGGIAWQRGKGSWTARVYVEKLERTVT